MLLAAGRPAEAERVFREDLDRFPDNGWSLDGLESALRAMDRDREADQVADRFAEAWRHADVRVEELRASVR